MSAVKNLEILAQPEPKTRLKIVRGGKSDSIPIPPISPATPIVKKGSLVCWQLQLDFEKPLQPLPKSNEPSAKGLEDRKQFIKLIGDPKRYNEMIRISRGEVIKHLNRSTTMRGLQPWEEEQLYMDHMHDTIVKISHRLELGFFGLPKKDEEIESYGRKATAMGLNELRRVVKAKTPSGEVIEIGVDDFHRHWKIVGGVPGNLMGYFYVFLKMDAARFVKTMDMAAINSFVIDDDEDNDECDHRSSMVGALAATLSELPTFLEGSRHDLMLYLYDYTLEWVLWNVRDTEQDLLDADFFRRFYGMGQKIKEIKIATGYNTHRISTGHKRACAIAVDNIDYAALVEQFAIRSLNGCDVCKEKAPV